MLDSNKRIFLCRPSGEPLTTLNGVDISTVNYTENLKDYDTLTFTVDRYITVMEYDEVYQTESNGYDDLKVKMKLFLEDIGYFIIEEPALENDGYKESKTVTAYSLECELTSKVIYGLKINRGTSDSYEYLEKENINDLGYAREYVKFYNDVNDDAKKYSLLHIILTYAPGWSIDFVDPSLPNQKLSIEAEQTNVYAFLTSEIAPKARCIFLFDTIERKINAYSEKTLGAESSIYISSRNLQQVIRMECDEDSLATRYNVLGNGDLDIRNVNYGDRMIVDLGYMLETEPYMTKELADKVQNWLNYRNRKDNRDEYIQTAKKVLDLNSKIDEINLRVPHDGCYWKQWDEMDEKLLIKNQAYYNALLTSLQMSVDPDNTEILDNYIPWKNDDGETDHDAYKDALKKMENGYGGYYTYIEILEYILPNIQIAIDNIIPPGEEKPKYKDGYEEEWDLYGIKELEAKKKFFEKQIKEVLKDYELEWENPKRDPKAGANTKEQYEQYHAQYEKFNSYLENKDKSEGPLIVKLNDLKAEVRELEAAQKLEADKLEMLKENASLEHPDFGFIIYGENEEVIDDSDYIAVNQLFFDADYRNEHILTTSLDTTLTTLDVQETLYKDAMEKLSEASSPQYSFHSDMDNLLALEEFKHWSDNFIIGNFIMVQIRDDYNEKLRIISRSWNPCAADSELSVEFSQMITSKSGRNDFSHIFDDTVGRTGANSTSLTGTNSSKDSLELSTDLVRMITNSGLLNQAVGDMILDEARVIELIAEYVNEYHK